MPLWGEVVVRGWMPGLLQHGLDHGLVQFLVQLQVEGAAAGFFVRFGRFTGMVGFPVGVCEVGGRYQGRQ